MKIKFAPGDEIFPGDILKVVTNQACHFKEDIDKPGGGALFFSKEVYFFVLDYKLKKRSRIFYSRVLYGDKTIWLETHEYHKIWERYYLRFHFEKL